MKLTNTSLRISLAVLVVGSMLPSALQAGATYEKSVQTTASFDPFARGVWELELSAGAFGSVDTDGDALKPDVGLGLGNLRLGYMLNDPAGSGFFRGNFELLGGAYGGWVFDGPGEYVVGGELGLRYNFVQPSAKVVPFIQIGGGGIYSDMAKDDLIQDLVGSEWSWQLHGVVGLRFMMSDHCALTVAAQYFHISNAGSDERNAGLNTIGGLLGVSWFF